MDEFKHEHLDLLKMDIEGAEYGVIYDIIKSGLSIKQLLIEFHHGFPGVGIKNTKNSIELLNTEGYRIFAISKNGQEYSFIKP